jgi:CNT family concentrative nucleoside transporter
MQRTMRLSGAESLAAAGNIFLGQTEAPLLIKPYIEKMTRSELFALMSGGMATIAGSVFGLYIGMLGGDNPAEKAEFAKHLLTASILSAPAAIVAAKLMIPETGEVKAEAEITVEVEDVGHNPFEALTIGTTDGLRLALNVGAMLIVFIACVAAINAFLGGFIGALGADPQAGSTGWVNEWLAGVSGGLYDTLTLQAIFGYLFAPVAWIIGVDYGSLLVVGQLLGEKLVATEFVAYASLGELKASGAFADREAIIITTYALCGFSNVASMGIQIGGIAALAPKRRADLGALAPKSLISGTVACLMTACIAGVLIQGD